MKILDSFKELSKRFDDMSLEDVSAWKKILLIFLFVDIFLVHYYLGWKKLALAIMIVTVGGLAYLLFLERKKRGLDDDSIPVDNPKPPKRPPKTSQPKKVEKVMEEPKDQGFTFDITPEEIEKRLEKAIST